MKIGGPGIVEPDDAHLDRELTSVGVQRRHLDPLAQYGPLAGREEVPQAKQMRFAAFGRDQQLDHRPADHIKPVMTECALRGCVELHDVAVLVDRHERVERRVDHRPNAGLARLERRFAPSRNSCLLR